MSCMHILHSPPTFNRKAIAHNINYGNFVLKKHKFSFKYNIAYSVFRKFKLAFSLFLRPLPARTSPHHSLFCTNSCKYIK